MSPLHPPEKFIHWIAVTKFDGERGILLAGERRATRAKR
jgi:hypothetical protein